MIPVQGVAKSFGSTATVPGQPFQAPDCSITDLPGANGVGKTTRLRMIAGVLEPDADDIQVGGAVARQGAEARRAELGALLDHTRVHGDLAVDTTRFVAVT